MKPNAVKIQWPTVDADGNLKISDQWRSDDCLEFHPDGRISSNGGRVEHHELQEEQIDLLQPCEQKFVRAFLIGIFDNTPTTVDELASR